MISANVKYHNPDADTLRWLIDARGADNYTLHIYNRQDWMDAFFDGLRAGRNFVVKYRGGLDDDSTIDEIILD